MDIGSELISAFKKNSRIVVLTGAGISKESGIPTFRDAQDGLWANYSPKDLASMEGFKKNPKLVIDWYNWRREIVLKAEPNRAHLLLAQWEKHFPHLLVITQNVDGLHSKAGSERVLEIHGSIHRMKCLGKHHPSAWIDSDQPPRCQKCNSLLRPDLVWFGEMLSKAHLQEIDKALWDADIFIAIGTSGTVTPASTFLAEAKRRGAVTVVVNPDEGARGQADFFLQGKATEVMSALSEKLGLGM
jgi:NAD-dependent deacetylase